jgi:hypothetical protein
MQHEYWFNPDNSTQRDNADAFARFAATRIEIEFYWPNRVASPWHVQCRLNDVVLNFWPHLLKGQWPGEKALNGVKAMHKLIDRAHMHLHNACDVID